MNFSATLWRFLQTLFDRLTFKLAEPDAAAGSQGLGQIICAGILPGGAFEPQSLLDRALPFSGKDCQANHPNAQIGTG